MKKILIAAGILAFTLSSCKKVEIENPKVKTAERICGKVVKINSTTTLPFMTSTITVDFGGDKYETWETTDAYKIGQSFCRNK